MLEPQKVLSVFSKLTEPEQTLSTKNEMDVVSETENAMKVLAGTLAPGDCTRLEHQQNIAELCSYKSLDNLEAFEFENSAPIPSQDSLEPDFSDLDLNPDVEDITLVVLKKENKLNRPVFLNETETEVTYNETTQQVNSDLLTFSLFVGDIKTSVPVVFLLQHIMDTGKEELLSDDSTRYDVIRTPICTFWNEINASWSSWGCVMVSSSKSFSKCNCNHSTNFVILMQATYKEYLTPGIHGVVLEWLSVIGLVVSILALVLLLAIYIYLWRMLQSDRIFIHTNLAVALLVGQLLFLTGSDKAGSPVVCQIIALFLHFFFLSVFGWMLVEGMHLYMKVVKVYGSENIKMYRYVLIGWVAPAIICSISFAANHTGYGSEKYCWLRDHYIWAFIIPVIAVVMLNMLVLVMVVRIIVKSAQLHQEKSFDHVKAGLKGALILLPIVGGTWLFGLISFSSDTIVFQYLFVIFNAFQGLFIFLINCVFNTEVKAAFVRKRNKRREELSLDSRDIRMQSVRTQQVTVTEFLPGSSIQDEGNGLDQEPENIHKEAASGGHVIFVVTPPPPHQEEEPKSQTSSIKSFEEEIALSEIPEERDSVLGEEDAIRTCWTSTPSSSNSMELPGTPSPRPVSVASSRPDDPVVTPVPIEQECLITTPDVPVPQPVDRPWKNNFLKTKTVPWKY